MYGGLISTVTPVMSWSDLLGVDHRAHDIWVVSFKTWSRRSLFYGRAQTCRNQSNVQKSRRLLHVILDFETKILRSEWFAQVNLMSVAPTLQNLRIGLRRRQSGQEQGAREAAWKLAKNVIKFKEKIKQHSSLLRKIGACLHQILNLRNEHLLSTPERRCIWSA